MPQSLTNATGAKVSLWHLASTFIQVLIPPHENLQTTSSSHRKMGLLRERVYVGNAAPPPASDCPSFLRGYAMLSDRQWETPVSPASHPNPSLTGKDFS